MAVVGIVRTGTGNDRYAVIDRIHGELDGGQLLLVGHGRTLAGGAADDDGIGMAGDLILDNAAQLVKKLMLPSSYIGVMMWQHPHR